MRNKLFSYFGAKTKLLSELYKRLPRGYQQMVNIEVFGGSGVWMYKKPKAHIEIFNDLDEGISALFFSLVHHREELFEKLKYNVASRNNFKWYKEFEPKTIIDKGIKAAYRIHFSFSGLVGGSFVTPSKKRPRGDNKHILYDEALWTRWANRFHKTFIENKDFQDLMEYYDSKRAYYYLDPPYFVSTERGHSRPEGRGYYNINFYTSDHYRLFEVLQNVKGLWLLSYDDHPEVRKMYKDYHIEEVKLRYNARGTSKRLAQELLISNYKSLTSLADFM